MIDSKYKTKSSSDLNVLRGTETLLIVDDEELITKAVKRILQRLGYVVLIASDGEKALEVAERFTGEIHLAILDLGLPFMKGEEVFPLLKEVRPAMKIVVCSGCEHDEVPEALFELGADGFVQKPFENEDLLAVVRSAFDGPNSTFP